MENKTVESIEQCDNYLLIKFRLQEYDDFLDKYIYILTDGFDIVEIEPCDHISSSFEIDGEKYVVLTYYGFSRRIIHFPSKKIILEDAKGDVYKVDDNVLEIYGDKKRLFNINTRKFIDQKENYEYSDILKPGFYLFRENNIDKEFYKIKNYICNEFGEILFDNLVGYVYFKNNKIILKKEESFEIFDFENKEVKTISKGENIIAEPLLYSDKIICAFKDGIRMYDLDMKEIKYIPLELNKINDITFNANTLYLSIPDTNSYKHIFINLMNGNIMEHAHIEGYPYWTPTTFIGVDNRDENKEREHFIYNEYGELKRKIKTSGMGSIGSNDEVFRTYGEKENKHYLYNSKKDILKETGFYNYLYFRKKYGYGVKRNPDTLDFKDLEFNILYKNLDLKKYNISATDIINNEIGLTFINNYLIFNKYYGRKRTLIIDLNGNIVHDTHHEKVNIIGKYIQIKEDYKSAIYIDTTTGEKKVMYIELPFKDNKFCVEELVVDNISKIGMKVKKINK